MSAKILIFEPPVEGYAPGREAERERERERDIIKLLSRNFLPLQREAKNRQRGRMQSESGFETDAGFPLKNVQ